MQGAAGVDGHDEILLGDADLIPRAVVRVALTFMSLAQTVPYDSALNILHDPVFHTINKMYGTMCWLYPFVDAIGFVTRKLFFCIGTACQQYDWLIVFC